MKNIDINIAFFGAAALLALSAFGVLYGLVSLAQFVNQYL